MDKSLESLVNDLRHSFIDYDDGNAIEQAILVKIDTLRARIDELGGYHDDI